MLEDEEKRHHLKTKKHIFKEMSLKMGFPIHLMMRAMSIAQQKNTERIIADVGPDILVHPDVENYSMFDLERYKEIYEAGVKATEKVLPKIKKIVLGE